MGRSLLCKHRNDWANDYKHLSSCKNLQSNSKQALDIQHYSSSDSPYLNGFLPYRKQMGNRLSVKQTRPLCAMLIDVPHQSTKHNPETQQNLPLLSTNGTEQTVSTNSFKTELNSMCLNLTHLLYKRNSTTNSNWVSKSNSKCQTIPPEWNFNQPH